ncbi:MAG: hypothetical protein E6J88_03305 [Deltaproteobacteria bacterium]|nr:MAG: hypothetical protein E6J88_03305 [Deltaproteobacteria bacterium]
MRWILIAFLLSPAVALATSETTAKEQAVAICKQQKKTIAPEKWEKGPCISNGQNGLADWVVDVAHAPRTAIDDDPSNQCSAFVEKKIKNFVELDTSCNVIRSQAK